MKLKPLLPLAFILFACMAAPSQILPGLKKSVVKCGADRTELYMSLLLGKGVGLVANPSSRIGPVHLLDTLLHSGISVSKVFAPEHGFRGEEEAGALIQGGLDPVTGVPVISLYGKHKKPTEEDLKGLDLVVFDIQDVGVRFYTYISTLHLVMEACAEAGVPLLVLDRPNPNGFYIDGPVLDTAYKSFVGMHPVPVVHGMTIGEYAGMINGEYLLMNRMQCELSVIPCQGYDHQTEYVLPVKPSPNLPDQVSVYLYPTLCFFEGTVVSIGRGTPFPFQVYGNPKMEGDFRFTPKSLPGFSMHPQFENQECRGRDLRKEGIKEIAGLPRLQLEWIIDAWTRMGKSKDFFIGYFDTLAGSKELRTQIQQGKTVSEIRESWQPGLSKFQTIRSKYLLYPDFRK